MGIKDQLYVENTSAVIVNDGMTEQIALGQGTRQSYPVSLVLFCLITEMLANVIRNDDLIEGRYFIIRYF